MSSLHEMINYRHPGHFIGDVHPFFDPVSKQWLLYYLLPGGLYQSTLSVSKDLIHWEDVPLTFENTPRAPYYVVAILNYRGKRYSWFGQSDVHVCSVSDDGIHWRAKPDFDIPVNKMASPLGERDPFITFDSANNCFYAVALSYIKSPTDCAITLKKTAGSHLDQWEWLSLPILHFANTSCWEYGEPECPQLIKIRRRWYLFASLAHRSVHHVGGFSYWIGDEDMSPEKVDWEHKPRHMLTSEDLCATQIAVHHQQLYAFGWIPQNAQGSEWGGHVNSPFRVRSTSDGTLTTEPDETFWNHFSFTPLHEAKKQSHFECTLPGKGVLAVSAFLVFDTKATFTFQNMVTDIHVVLDAAKGLASVQDSLGYVFASMAMPEAKKELRYDVWMVLNEDILEIHLNHEVSLHARVSRPISHDHLMIRSPLIEQVSVSQIQIKEEV